MECAKGSVQRPMYLAVCVLQGPSPHTRRPGLLETDLPSRPPGGSKKWSTVVVLRAVPALAGSRGWLLVLAASGHISTEGSLEVETVAATWLCPGDWLQARKWPFIQTAGAVTVQQCGVYWQCSASMYLAVCDTLEDPASWKLTSPPGHLLVL